MKCDNSRIFQILSERKITQTALAKAIGVSTGNVTDWKNGRCYPSIECIPRIADYFGVTTDYLLGRVSPPVPATQDDPQEQRLLSLFRVLNPAGQDYLLKQAAFAAQQEEFKQEFSAAQDA